MKKFLVLGAALVLPHFAQAETHFTPYTGITTALQGVTCAAIDGNKFDKNPTIDYFTSECLGFNGWRVISYGGDSRSTVKLISNTNEVDLQSEMESFGSFSNAGDTLEFRIFRQRAVSAQAVAALVSVKAQDPANAKKSIGEILIVKLADDKSCVIDRVAIAADEKAAWNQARTLADSKAKTAVCP